MEYQTVITLQVDVLPSKNQVATLLQFKPVNHCHSVMTSCEQRLITKKHIAFGLTCSILKHYFLKAGILNSSQSICKLHNMHGMPTFKTEVLHLVSNVLLIKGLLL